MTIVRYADLVATPPGYADPLEKEGVQMEVDYWGLVCELYLALGVMPLECRLYTHGFGKWFSMNRWVLIFNNSNDELLDIPVMHCEISHCGSSVIRVSPWEQVFLKPDYDYSELKVALEAEIERLLEADGAKV